MSDRDAGTIRAFYNFAGLDSLLHHFAMALQEYTVSICMTFYPAYVSPIMTVGIIRSSGALSRALEKKWPIHAVGS